MSPEIPWPISTKMTPFVEELLPRLEALPVSERAELASFLLDSLDADSPVETEAEFDAKLTRRVEEIQSGREKGVAADELYARLLSSKR